MDFEFSTEQEQLRDAVRRFLAARAPLASLRERYGSPAPYERGTWLELAQLGAVELLAPEASTGMVDAAVVLEELGRAVYGGPYISSAIGALSLSGACGETGLAAQLASGSTIGVLAVDEPSQPASWRVPSTGADLAGRLSGQKVHVGDLASADVVLVTASDHRGHFGVFSVDPSDTGVAIEPTPTVDGSRAEGTLTLTDAPGRRLDADRAVAAVTTTIDRIAAALCVDAVGAAARALELALDYARERVAFDRPIGSFQAIQHLCADMLRSVELARAASYYACWALDQAEPAEAHRAVTMAKAFSAEALPAVGASAIQIFGGVGFTWEHDIHLYYKRLLTAGTARGSADDHLHELARIVIG